MSPQIEGDSAMFELHRAQFLYTEVIIWKGKWPLP